MKEFSNDPTEAIKEISSLFEMKLSIIQKDLVFLKKEIEKSSKLIQQGKHRDCIVKTLSKRVTEHINGFKKALKTHSENVELRKKRMTKYGEGVDELKTVGVVGALNDMDSLRSNYAMFSPQNTLNGLLPEGGVGIEKNTSLLRNRRPISSSAPNSSNMALPLDDKKTRGPGGYFAAFSRRAAPPAASSSSSSSNISGLPRSFSSQLSLQQQQQQQQVPMKQSTDRSRLEQAEKVESSIMQVPSASISIFCFNLHFDWSL